MYQIVKTFGEIFVCFLAAVGILYLLRDLYLTVFYRKKKCRLPLFMCIGEMSFADINNILFETRNILQSRRASAYIEKIYMVGKEDTVLTDTQIKRLEEDFCDIAAFASKDEISEIISGAKKV